jgi:transcription termination/antitermination protein NusG
MSDIKKRWYVIRAISGKEKRVKEQLELEIDRNNLTIMLNKCLFLPKRYTKLKTAKK